MTRVIIKSFKEDLLKISLTKLQMNLLDKSLKEAKENVDNLIGGEELVFEIDDDILAKQFSKEANSIGANCILE